MIIHLEACFVGDTDKGYCKGSTYQIRISSKLWSAQVGVTATHGYQLKPVHGMELTYANLTEFFREWKTLNVQDAQALF